MLSNRIPRGWTRPSQSRGIDSISSSPTNPTSQRNLISDMTGSSGLLRGQSTAGVVQLIILPSAAASQMASPGQKPQRRGSARRCKHATTKHPTSIDM
ncbi:hypothetical protein HDV57DRAFT_485544 [Trichoderma longibrachiatum]|uniref:Uncharacterized protein n=1 Tax=Trichoderma longibrachiatum ATCC 18648 TaxID=983965 RepID=A0A2T4CCH5_TRILO|nr:hypothetical protein M440DRAFT_1164337 [Trichoderma longibrachiatum ATCC 18648]